MADKVGMHDRRSEGRFLCAELVQVQWKAPEGGVRRSSGVLEDISSSGACLQFDSPVPLHTRMHVEHSNGALEGIVKYCLYRDVGYFVGIHFTGGQKWSQEEFTPHHLLDLTRLVNRSASRAARRRQN